MRSLDLMHYFWTKYTKHMKLSFCQCLYSINAFCIHFILYIAWRVSLHTPANTKHWVLFTLSVSNCGLDSTTETCPHRYRRPSVWINLTAGLNEPNYWFENALKQLNKKQNILQCNALKFVETVCFCDWTFLIRSSIYKLHWTYYILKLLSNYVILFLFVNRNSGVI